MDLEAFSDDNFDTAYWINAAFQSTTDDNDKESFVSNLVSKLQLYVQQVNSVLEDTSQQILGNMPRMVQDGQNVQQEAMILKSKMSEVQDEIKQVQHETGSCMSNLEQLDKLKTKLQTAKQGLQESDGWGGLISELEELFENNDVIGACDKLLGLQQSLAAQKGLPGQDDREMQVEGYKNRLEAATSPAVVQCFTNGDIEQSKNYVKMFTSMNRFAQLTQYYRTIQKRIIQQQWTEIVELSSNTGSTRFLREFYDYLMENWQKQAKWCTNVFGSQTGIIEPILTMTESLQLLSSARQTAVKNCIKQNNEKMIVLQELSSANVYFGSRVQKDVDSMALNIPRDTLKDLSNAIFDYMHDQIYISLEQTQLNKSLTDLTLVHETVYDTVRSIGNANTKVFEWAEQALNRCDAITQNCAIAEIINLFNIYFKSFMESYKKAQQQLHATTRTEQNWILLQSCVTVLQNIGDVRIQLLDFEEKVSAAFIAKNKQVEELSTETIQFGYHINRKIKENTFKKLLDCIEQESLISDGSDSSSRHSELRGYKGLFSSVHEIIKTLCEYIHDTILAAVFLPIENHLKVILPENSPSFSTSGSGDLPSYSFVPQEFITQVGQYLLTLPQHLEPLLLSPTTALKVALDQCDERYYTSNMPGADILLSLLVEESCALYEEKISQIVSLTSTNSKQLATDIDYLESLLEELGLTLSSNLQQTSKLLRASTESYLSLSSGCDPKLVTRIRQLRNIISTE